MMRVTYVELLGEKHPLCFSLTASAELSDSFGGLGEMGKELTCGDTARVARASGKVLDILIKAGRVYGKAMGWDLPKPLPCPAADLVDARDVETMAAVRNAISVGSKREVETEGNAEATQG